jgi:Nucleoside 2-deoxyribosyltransferase
MQVVVCGSFGDLEGFLQCLHIFQAKYGTANVFPNKEHMEASMPCILAHHVLEKETDKTIVKRAQLMETYFKRIDAADLIVVVNQKNGEEYYGTGTTIEIGYALARGKRVHFIKEPTNPNILSLMRIVSSTDTLARRELLSSL